MLLPLLYFLGLFLHTFLIRHLRQHLDCRVGLQHQITQRVCHVIGDIHQQRVLIDKHGIAQPVMNGVALLVGFYHKSAVTIKVQGFNLWQERVAISEIHRELIGLYTLCLQQETVCLRMCKCQERDIIGQEMGIRRLSKRVDMQRIAPDCIRTNIGLRRWSEDLMIESDHLTLLFKAVVTIHVLKGVCPIGTWRHTLHHKMSPAVGARNTHQRFCGKGSI